MQIQLLRQWRAAGSPGEKAGNPGDPGTVLYRALVASVNGISHGLQASG
jgi:hypothetical protein